MGYGRKSAASGQWCTVLGSGVRGQDPSGEGGVLGGVVLFWVGAQRRQASAQAATRLGGAYVGRDGNAVAALREAVCWGDRIEFEKNK